MSIGGRVGDLGTALHGELGGFRELALEGADDEKPHDQPAFTISVIVTPRRFSTSTISPRATRRSLTKISTASPTWRSSSTTRADIHLQEVRDRDAGAAENHGDANRNVEDGLEIARGAFDDLLGAIAFRRVHFFEAKIRLHPTGFVDH